MINLYPATFHKRIDDIAIGHVFAQRILPKIMVRHYMLLMKQPFETIANYLPMY